jgi:hypothetical protein
MVLAVQGMYCPLARGGSTTADSTQGDSLGRKRAQDHRHTTHNAERKEGTTITPNFAADMHNALCW